MLLPDVVVPPLELEVPPELLAELDDDVLPLELDDAAPLPELEPLERVAPVLDVEPLPLEPPAGALAQPVSKAARSKDHRAIA